MTDLIIGVLMTLCINADNYIVEENYIKNNSKVFEVTMYTSGYESTGKRPGDRGYNITARGTQARHGVIASGPSYPFGTRIYLEGLGEFVVEDRGGAVSDDHIDIWTDDLDRAYQWGRRKVKGWVVQ